MVSHEHDDGPSYSKSVKSPSVLPEDLDFLSDDDDGGLSGKIQINDGVYDRYEFNLERDKSLPIHDAKDEIITTIRKHPVVILEGDTGCGKTTQVRLKKYFIKHILRISLRSTLILYWQNILWR